MLFSPLRNSNICVQRKLEREKRAEIMGKGEADHGAEDLVESCVMQKTFGSGEDLE